MSHSDKAQVFLTYWNMFAPKTLPAPIGEHPFSKVIGRRHRFDWAWVDPQIAVEVDGGNMMTRQTKGGQVIPVGRHTKPSDYEKLNIAASLGWRVFRFIPEMLVREPEACIDIVVKALRETAEELT